MLAALKRGAKVCLGRLGLDISRTPRAKNESAPRQNDAALRYLLGEVSELRILVRALTAASGVRALDIVQTQQSFSFQWDKIGSGKHLIGDPDFERETCALACRYSDMPPQAFADR